MPTISTSLNALDAPVRAEAVGKDVDTANGRLTILNGIDLAVERAESVAIVGESGAGKSTLLSLLAGLDVPSRGRLWLQGEELAALDEDERARLRAGRVGFVFQSFQLLPALTALENVMLPLELAGRSGARATAQDTLDRVGLGERLTHYPQQLSGGEQQRVALARAFAIQPAVLFADEPTGNLDTDTGAQIEALMFQLNRDSGTTLILVTHDIRLAGRCTRRVRLHAGRIEGEPG